MRVQLPDGVKDQVAHIKGGIHPDYNKNTHNSEPVTMPSPKTVRLPVSMHIGTACEPIVKVRDKVGLGQVIADSTSRISSPIHATVSGTVKSIREGDVTSSGSKVQIIEIESDGEMRPYEGLKIPEIRSKEDFIKAVRDSGVVGLGGAGFPTSAKLDTPPGITIDTLVVNGAECEPYITVDDYAMNNDIEPFFIGLSNTMKWLNIDRAIIGIEDNKVEAMENLLSYIKKDPALDINKNIDVVSFKAQYPQGAEKIIIYQTTGRKVPVGKLPHDVGVLVLNVNTLLEIGIFISTGMPLLTRLITVDGSAVRTPMNVLVPIGTSIAEVLDFVGLRENPSLVIMGGPMMGVAVSSLDKTIIKQNNALLALTEKDYSLADESECIRCAHCIDHCPMHLQPTSIMKALKKDEMDKVMDLQVMACIECGCCDYVCPAKIPLVHYMRSAKTKVRELGGHK